MSFFYFSGNETFHVFCVYDRKFFFLETNHKFNSPERKVSNDWNQIYDLFNWLEFHGKEVKVNLTTKYEPQQVFNTGHGISNLKRKKN